MTRAVRQPLNLLRDAIDAQCAKLAPEDRVALLHALAGHLVRVADSSYTDAEETEAEDEQNKAE